MFHAATDYLNCNFLILMLHQVQYILNNHHYRATNNNNYQPQKSCLMKASSSPLIVPPAVSLSQQQVITTPYDELCPSHCSTHQWKTYYPPTSHASVSQVICLYQVYVP